MPTAEGEKSLWDKLTDFGKSELGVATGASILILVALQCCREVLVNFIMNMFSKISKAARGGQDSSVGESESRNSRTGYDDYGDQESLSYGDDSVSEENSEDSRSLGSDGSSVSTSSDARFVSEEGSNGEEDQEVKDTRAGDDQEEQNNREEAVREDIVSGSNLDEKNRTTTSAATGVPAALMNHYGGTLI